MKNPPKLKKNNKNSIVSALYNVYVYRYVYIHYLPWSSRGGIFHNHDLCDVSILGEILSKALWNNKTIWLFLTREITHKYVFIYDYIIRLTLLNILMLYFLS